MQNDQPAAVSAPKATPEQPPLPPTQAQQYPQQYQQPPPPQYQQQGPPQGYMGPPPQQQPYYQPYGGVPPQQQQQQQQPPPPPAGAYGQGGYVAWGQPNNNQPTKKCPLITNLVLGSLMTLFFAMSCGLPWANTVGGYTSSTFSLWEVCGDSSCTTYTDQDLCAIFGSSDGTTECSAASRIGFLRFATIISVLVMVPVIILWAVLKCQGQPCMSAQTHRRMNFGLMTFVLTVGLFAAGVGGSIVGELACRLGSDMIFGAGFALYLTAILMTIATLLVSSMIE